MNITIREQQPDGIVLDLNDVYLDTYEQAFEVIKLMESIKRHNKIDVEECKEMLDNVQVSGE